MEERNVRVKRRRDLNHPCDRNRVQREEEDKVEKPSNILICNKIQKYFTLHFYRDYRRSTARTNGTSAKRTGRRRRSRKSAGRDIISEIRSNGEVKERNKEDQNYNEEVDATKTKPNIRKDTLRSAKA